MTKDEALVAEADRVLGELRLAVREAHAAVKDLRLAMREVREMTQADLRTQMQAKVTAVTAESTAVITEAVEAAGQAALDRMDQITAALLAEGTDASFEDSLRRYLKRTSPTAGGLG